MVSDKVLLQYNDIIFLFFLKLSQTNRQTHTHAYKKNPTTHKAYGLYLDHLTDYEMFL